MGLRTTEKSHRNMPKIASDRQKIAPICFTGVTHWKSRPPHRQRRLVRKIGSLLLSAVISHIGSHSGCSLMSVCECEMKRRREMGRVVRVCDEGRRKEGKKEKEKEKRRTGEAVVRVRERNWRKEKENERKKGNGEGESDVSKEKEKKRGKGKEKCVAERGEDKFIFSHPILARHVAVSGYSFYFKAYTSYKLLQYPTLYYFII